MDFQVKVEGIEELIKEVAKTQQQYSLAIKKIAIELFRRVILKTPVDTGHARANWQASINSPISSIVDTEDPSGKATINNMVNIILSQRDTPKISYWLSNNLPYIEVLEHGLYPNPPKKGTGKTTGGFSVQAPTGMIQAALVELEQIVRRIDNEL
jgi:hypothetical protein